MTRNRSGQAGFTLLHVVIALPLLMIFLILGSKLFITNQGMLSAAAQAEEQLNRTDAALHTLRSDVWTASSATLSPTALSLDGVSGSTRWSIDDAGTLTRTDPSSDVLPIVFNGVAAQSFEAQPGVIIVRLADETYVVPIDAPVTSQGLDSTRKGGTR
jgi:type II secretory pathway pseudopilin PulG